PGVVRRPPGPVRPGPAPPHGAGRPGVLPRPHRRRPAARPGRPPAPPRAAPPVPRGGGRGQQPGPAAGRPGRPIPRPRRVRQPGLGCRLTARRCPPEVAARRRQKLRAYTRSKKGREPSARQLVLCDWLVLATNVPADRLTAVELWVVYRCRWQVELLFKRGKQ